MWKKILIFILLKILRKSADYVDEWLMNNYQKKSGNVDKEYANTLRYFRRLRKWSLITK